MDRLKAEVRELKGWRLILNSCGEGASVGWCVVLRVVEEERVLKGIVVGVFTDDRGMCKIWFFAASVFRRGIAGEGVVAESEAGEKESIGCGDTELMV